MPSRLKLGSANAALVSLYFAPAWAIEAVRALTSPFNGFEDRSLTVTATYFRELFNLGLDGLIRLASGLAGLKLVMAAGFVAYAIEYGRALLTSREPNRETLDIVLVLGCAMTALWAWPALLAGDAGLIRLHATEFLLLAGAAVVITVERQMAPAPAVEAATRTATLARESGLAPNGLSGRLAAGGR
jgi:hypothetical protein